MKKIIQPAEAPAPVGPYSQAVMAGNWLYLSGQIAVNPNTGEIINRTIEEETHQILTNIRTILDEAGLGFDDVVKCTVFVRDMEHYGIINAIYGEYFGLDGAPARELVEVSRLPKDVNIEISAVAYGGA